MLATLKEARIGYLLVCGAGGSSGSILAYAFRRESGSLTLWLAGGLILGALFLLSAWQLTARALAPQAGSDTRSSQRQCLWAFTAYGILPVLFLPYVVYQTQRQGALLRYELVSPHWQGFFVALVSAALVFALLANRFPALQAGPIRLAARRPTFTLAVMVIAWIGIAVMLDILKIHNLHEEGMNTSNFVDALRHVFSSQGPLYSNLLQGNGSSLLGLHTSLIWFLVFPLFAIWPNYMWLLSISDIALGLAAIPVYLISRRFFSPGISLLIAAIFLFNRTIIAQPGAGDLSEERFLPVLLLFAFYFWFRKSYLWFIAFALLALTVREDVGIVLSLLGFIGLVTRRRLGWWLVPAALGTIWFVGSVAWVIPHFSPTGVTRAAVIYSGLGDTGREVATTILFRPWKVLQTMFADTRHFSTWYLLFQSFGFGIPLLSGYILLGLPPVAESMLVPLPSLNHFNASAVAATLFPAMITGFAIADRLSRKYYRVSVAAGLVIVTLFVNVALIYTWFTPGRYSPGENYDAAMQIMALLPDDASVIMPNYMIPRAPAGQKIQGYYQLSYEYKNLDGLDIEQEYVIIDSEPFPEAWRRDLTYDGLALVKEAILESPQYHKVFDAGNLQLYKKA